MRILTDQARPRAQAAAHGPGGPVGLAGVSGAVSGRLDPEQRLAVVVPVTGPLTLVTMTPDVVRLARHEIGCDTVERLHLGSGLIEAEAQMWVDEDGLLTGRPPNPRASAVVAASTYPPLPLRQHFVGTAVFTGPDDPSGERTLGLSLPEAIVLLRATHTHGATRASDSPTARTSEDTPGGSDADLA